jgi:hypothetical protein
MAHHNTAHEFGLKSNENEKQSFTDKLQTLLPEIEFEESVELLDARTAVLEALTMDESEPDLIRLVWVEYAKICERIVDSRAADGSPIRAQIQIAVLIHKALIFHEAKNIQRYNEDLYDAAAYAYNMRFEKIVEAIDAELRKLTK